METVIVDARKIMDAPKPVQYCAQLFGLDTNVLEDLRLQLQASDQNRIVEVMNWPSPKKGWEPIADMLEGVQQHSSYFYLIWGTENDYVDIHASDEQSALINPPQS